MAQNLTPITLPLGAFSGATELPLYHVPTDEGGVTVVEAWTVIHSAGTIIGGLLVTMTDVATGGTPAINGTIGSFAGTIVLAAGVVHKLTISKSWVAGGSWIGFDQTSGTALAGAAIQINAVQGRA